MNDDIEIDVEVYKDFVTIKIEDFMDARLTNKQLDEAFYNNHMLYLATDDQDKASVMDEIITYTFRLRHQKRQLYKELGFKNW